jgi:hypothetical protein
MGRPEGTAAAAEVRGPPPRRTASLLSLLLHACTTAVVEADNHKNPAPARTKHSPRPQPVNSAAHSSQPCQAW